MNPRRRMLPRFASRSRSRALAFFFPSLLSLSRGEEGDTVGIVCSRLSPGRISSLVDFASSIRLAIIVPEDRRHEFQFLANSFNACRGMLFTTLVVFNSLAFDQFPGQPETRASPVSNSFLISSSRPATLATNTVRLFLSFFFFFFFLVF